MTNLDKDITLLKQYCTRLKFEVVQEHKNAGAWDFYLKANDAIILLEQKPEFDFCIVFYTLTIQDTKLQQILDKVDQNPQFIYGLKSAIFDPQVGVSFILDGQHFRGYHISKKIFLHGGPPFSIKDFDDAIQAVTIVGLRGSAFVNSVLGNNQTEQKIVEGALNNSPDGMYS